VADRFAPPGEKPILTGWLRALGFTGSDQIAPPRIWERVNAGLITDERELSAFTPGARGRVGGAQAGVAAVLSTFQIIAGEGGLRVWCGPLGASWQYAVLPPVTLANVTPLPINWSDPNRLGTATAQRGTVAVVPFVSAPQGGTLATVWGNNPDEWVPPGLAFVLWHLTVNTALTAAFTFIEHLSRPT
jgi:hypothetical protein